ncbi:MAG: hypothetical protein ACTSW2_08880 [Alphaproteobacteria bacterium]
MNSVNKYRIGWAAAMVVWLAGAVPGHTGELSWSVDVASELRIFPNRPAFPRQDGNALVPSISVEPEVIYEWNGRNDRFTFVPFARLDAGDDARTHVDVREANWLHLGEDWDLVAGIAKVYWGVTESRHLVNIINQTDGVEDIDDEDKLGQPMVNVNLIRDWGTFGVFVLPGFRERTFPNVDARLGGPLRIDDGNATYDSSAEEGHVDFVARWRKTFGNWDVGLSEFVGTSREPRLIPGTLNGESVLVPHYDQIDQTGLDVQFTGDATLWKLEAITRGGHGDRFFAAVGGLEHTIFGAFDTNADIGLLAEYLYDGRDAAGAPATSADDDIFLATRLTLNDEQDTALLAGVIVDRDTQATLLSIEAERRLGDSWKLELEGRLFLNIPSNDPLAAVRRDDFITLRLTRYF